MIAAGGGMGDVLLATPLMRALRQRFARVVALTRPAQRDVLRGNPALDDVWLDDAPLPAMRARLAAGRFDAAIVTWATARYAMLPALAGIPVRVGQARRPYSRLFTRRVVVRSELGDRTTHWTEILLDYARALGCDGDPQPTFRVDPAARARVAALLAVRGVDVTAARDATSGAYGVLHPSRGISSARARWPVAPFVQLGAALRARHGLPLVITGGPDDRDAAQRIAERCGALSLAGETSVPEFAALAESARFVVAMDSGPMHLAAAVGAPTVGIFAMQPDEPDRWRPIGPRVRILRPRYPCPPRHRKETCPDFACVRALDVPAVLDALDGLLEGGAEAEPHGGAAAGRLADDPLR